MNARNRIFIILGILFVISLCWYFFSTNRSADLQLIGTVDANEVVVSSRIPGRIQTLTVDEGDDVQAGQLIATIQSDDLAAAQQGCRGNRGQRALQAAGSQRYRTPDPWRHVQPGSQCRGAAAQCAGRAGAGAGPVRASGCRYLAYRRAGRTGDHELPVAR